MVLRVNRAVRNVRREPLASAPDRDPTSTRASSWLIGAVVVIVTTLLFLLFFPDLRHWFVAPVTLCGVLAAPDAVDWVRKRLDIFDPQGLLGLMGLHFFFLAPMLHIPFDYWARFVEPSTDWRHALGHMA